MRSLYEDNTEIQIATNFIDALVSDAKEDWDKLRTLEKFKLFFANPDENILRAMRKVLQDKLRGFGQEFKSDSVGERSKLNKYLSLLTLANIRPGSRYYIPIWDASRTAWNLVEYKVELIELTPTAGLKALIIADKDRFFAYGLVPIENTDRKNISPPAHLIFMNAPYPSNQGYLTQLFLNFQLLKAAYYGYKDIISKWIKDTCESHKITVELHGMGFAGRMAYMPVLDGDTSSHISRVDISHNNTHDFYVDSTWKRLQNNAENGLQLAENSYNLDGMLHEWLVTNEQLDGSSSNENNFHGYWYNLLVNIVLNRILNWFIVYPIYYLVIPLCRAVLHHKIELAVMSALIMIFVTLPGLLMTTSGIVVTVFAAAYVAYKLIEPIKEILNFNEKKEPSCHKLDRTELREELDLIHDGILMNNERAAAL